MGFPEGGKGFYFFARRDFLMVDLPLATSFLPLAAGFLEELLPEGFLMAGAAGLAFLAGVLTLGGGFAFPRWAAGVFLGLGLDSLRFMGGALLRDFGGGLFCILPEREHKSSEEAQTPLRAELLSSICIDEADLGILLLHHSCSFVQQHISLAKSQRARTPLVDLARLSTSQSPQCSARDVSSSFLSHINIQELPRTPSQLSEQLRPKHSLSSLNGILLLNQHHLSQSHILGFRSGHRTANTGGKKFSWGSTSMQKGPRESQHCCEAQKVTSRD